MYIRISVYVWYAEKKNHRRTSGRNGNSSDKMLHERSGISVVRARVIRGNDDDAIETAVSTEKTDVIEEDFGRIGANDWRNIIHDREKWPEAVMAAETLVGRIEPK